MDRKTEAFIKDRTDRACERCGKKGVHVDTDANEIVIHGIPFYPSEWEHLVEGDWVALMTDERGHLVCDECYKKVE